MEQPKIFTKNIPVDERLPGKLFIRVELDKFPDDPDEKTIWVTSHNDIKEDGIIGTRSSLDGLDATIKQVMDSHMMYLFEKEKENVIKYLENRGFNPFYSSIIR